MKRLITTLAIMVFSPLLFAAPHPAAHPPLVIKETLQVVSHSVQKDDKAARYELHVQFPQLEGDLDSFANDFNQHIQHYVDTQLKEFMKRLADVNIGASPEGGSSSLWIDYTLTAMKPSENRVISVLFKTEMMLAGQAHPVHTLAVFNDDLTSGMPIVLPDLFKLDAEYLEMIANYCRTQLRHVVKNEDKNWFKKGTAPTPENYRYWTIQPTGLLFTFDEYQVAAYAVGQPHVLIPYSALAEIMTPTAPIAACVEDVTQCQGVST